MKLREADERARSALAAMEARRQAQGQQLLDKLAAAKSEEMARTEAVEHALGEHRHATREAVETGYRANRTRSDELHAEMQSLEERLTTIVEDAQKKESARAQAILQKTQEQVRKGEPERKRRCLPAFFPPQLFELRTKTMDGASSVRVYNGDLCFSSF